MKINRPTEKRAVVQFRDVDIGSHFELDGHLYMKRMVSARSWNAVMKRMVGVRSWNAVLLQECGCVLADVALEAQCILVDVEISYTYKPNAG